jgi:hypothetical protein
MTDPPSVSDERGETVTEAAATVLVAHQRKDIGSCLCGWAELGRSHAVHQAVQLRMAGLLARSSDR